MIQAQLRLLCAAFLPLALSIGCPSDPADDDVTDDTGDDDGSDDGTPGGDVTPEVLASGGSCSAPSGAGTDHTTGITADETWTAADSPHRIPGDLTIEATVTIEPCAVVLLGEAVYVEVGSSTTVGAIVAHGEVSSSDVRPVRFDRLDDGNWAQILVGAQGTIDLSVAAVMNGGNAPINVQGALVLQGAAGGTNLAEVVRNGTLDRVLVSGSTSFGINLDAFAGFTEDSEQVWIQGCGSEDQPYPVLVEPGVAGTLPAELVVEDNVRDEILVETLKTSMPDDTFADHGVPYHVRSTINIAPLADGPPATLTIEPGVTLAFERETGGGIFVGKSETAAGILVAEGTADAPIVFTSAQDPAAPGDWRGLYFRYTPTTGNRIAHAQIEYAGGESTYSSFGCGPGDNDAAIIIEGQGENDAGPDDVFVTDTAFDQIAGTTVIVSGWTDDAGPDFSEGNTFGATTPDCKVSRPRRSGAGDVCDGDRDVCWQ